MKAESFDILRVVGHYLTIEKQGAAYVALCPFHADRHPSLRIDPSKGLYHCFSCGAGGDALRFVMEKERAGFKEALRICSGICGVSPGRAVPAEVTRRDIAPAALPPEIRLLPYDPGHEALREVYATFGVGLAPTELPREYAFLRSRLVFPIHDTGGETVAYAARYLPGPVPKGLPKYLNSPTSARYKKDQLLYGWHRAVGRIRQTGTVIVVEGYKDALAMHAAGLTNTVALCGVSLSDSHVDLFRRESVATLCLFLDNDEAGRAATARIEARLRPSKEFSILNFQFSIPGKDADEIFRSLGPDTLRTHVTAALIPPARKEAEADLVRACLEWPDTPCLTPEGEEALLVPHILDSLATDDLWPEDERNRTALRACPTGIPPVGSALPTSPSLPHEERARRSQALRRYFLHYLELRLSARIRLRARGLLHAPDTSPSRPTHLSALQYDREYLKGISEELNRR